MNGRNYLEEIKAELEGGRKQWRAGASLLAAFGYVRRRTPAVDAINRELEDLGLKCEPSIDVDMPLDTPRIRFLLVGSNAEASSEDTQDTEVEGEVETRPQDTPVVSGFKVAELDAADKEVDCVRPDDQVRKAYTIMASSSYSQLVVANSQKPSSTAIKGIVSYRSITDALMHGSADTVNDCVESCPQVSIEDDIRVVIDHLRNNDVVLVIGVDKRLTGIITPWDLAEEFAKLAEPFKYIGEIETRLRRLVSERLAAEWDDVLQRFEIGEKTPIGMLDMGDLVRIVEHPDYWHKLGMPYDRATFVARLDDIRSYRNGLMHFREPPRSDETANVVNFCKMIRAVTLSQ